MEVVPVKKLFNGFASVRDYIIARAIKDGRDITIEYQDKTMRVPLAKLKAKWGLHDRIFKSKFNGGSYALYDFKFEADDDRKERQDNQPTLL